MPRTRRAAADNRNSLVIIGLVGGVGCGKSTAARELESLGALRIDADALAHEALCLPPVRKAVVRRFGPEVLGSHGEIDRSRLGPRAFAEPDGLRFLEELIHPVVGDWIRGRIARTRRTRSHELVVLDVPLLVESGLDAECDAVVMIATRRADRAHRTRRDRGWAADQAARREQFQATLAEKTRHANFRLDNRGTRSELEAGVRRLLERVRRARRLGTI